MASHNRTQLRRINHAAVSVAHIEGRRVLRSEAPHAGIFHLYPEDLNEVKIAYMATGNGVGFEFFEFIDPSHVPPAGSFQYALGGFHI
ncbi:hypothetical protein ABOM_010233 [Aspergillus bombycis]|uniref:Uncharacterized protein n=1 Tax=Aspergillus bombycis TaxID=109264 RepID=A0A1F7ZPK8_9EURO|nr:hypothetical protein ABOM_010233 [Aspergillus bombycis]OGM41048.1 hypothetical protein ABOM_010233 [Aspergillus bombycis]